MSKKIQRISAYGLLLKDEKLLLCRLAPRAINGGHWTLPGGGLDFGESPEDALVREFKEETGLVIRAGSLVTIDTLNDESHGNQYHSIRIVYEAHYVSGELTFEQEGSTDRCEWFSKSEARQLLLVPLAQLGIDHSFEGA